MPTYGAWDPAYVGDAVATAGGASQAVIGDGHVRSRVRVVDGGGLAKAIPTVSGGKAGAAALQTGPGAVGC